MATIREQMEGLLGETGVRQEQEEMEVDVDVKALLPQLVLAAQSMGLDLSDDEQLDAFLKTLKTLATSKAAMLKAAIRRWSPSKAAKAVKVAKSSI